MLNKKFYFILILFIILINFSINLQAFTLTSDVKTNASDSNRIEIILTVSDLQEYSDGINSLKGKLIYDKDIFKFISMDGTNNWSTVYNNEENNNNFGKFIILTTSGNTNKNIAIAKIVLELNNEITNIDTKIKIENIESSYKSEKLKSEDNIINLKIDSNIIKVIEDQKDNLDKQVITLEEQKNTKPKQLIYIYIMVSTVVLIIGIVILFKRRRTNEN